MVLNTLLTLVLYSTILYGKRWHMIDKTDGGILITKIKQLQGRIFEKLLDEHGISEFNGAQGRILFVLWEKMTFRSVNLPGKQDLPKQP